LTSETVPVSTSVPVLFPVREVSAACWTGVPPARKEPFSTVRVVVTSPVAASTSEMEITLPFATLKRRVVSSLKVWAAGTEFTGASFTAWTVTVTCALSVTPVGLVTV
jgi:hypothetical protein